MKNERKTPNLNNPEYYKLQSQVQMSFEKITFNPKIWRFSYPW